MKNRGITLGLTSTQNGPDSYVTRLQMAAFMYRLGFQNALLQGGNAFGATAVLGTTDGFALELHSGGQRVMRYEPHHSPSLIGGHPLNDATGMVGATIGGGGVSYAPNRVTHSFGTVGGGIDNVSGNNAGSGNSGATVGGGVSNVASGIASTVAGGSSNVASGDASAVAGGSLNVASGIASTVAGGVSNVAAGRSSFAAGKNARANFDGCFVYAHLSTDSFDSPTSCFAPNEIVIRGLGGFYFWTNGTNDNNYSGARLATGTRAWAQYSDRNGKHEIDLVDPRAVLEKLVAMPIATWQWKAEPGAVRHIGPMAQDFHAAFGFGDSDKQIVTVDADGVALAAIQGLNAKVESVRAAKDAEIATLRAELAAIRSLLSQDRTSR